MCQLSDKLTSASLAVELIKADRFSCDVLLVLETAIEEASIIVRKLNKDHRVSTIVTKFKAETA